MTNIEEHTIMKMNRLFENDYISTINSIIQQEILDSILALLQYVPPLPTLWVGGGKTNT